jgi:predicted dehydrogenase
MNTINVGIIGLGYWGPNYARIINQLEQTNLKWCCDINSTALDKFKTLYPLAKTTTNINELLDDKDLDAVIVVTPAQDHYETTKALLEKKIDVLVEKPLTTKAFLAERLVKLANKNGSILMVDHIFKFNSAIIKLKDLIDTKQIGDIFYIYGSYNALGPIRKDVSALWDLPHFIYVATYLYNQQPKSVSAIGKDLIGAKTEDVAFVTLEFNKGKLFHLHCSWVDPVKIRKITLVGNKKMVVFDDMSNDEKLTIYDVGVNVKKSPDFAKLETYIRTGDITIPKIENKEPLKEVVLNFINSVASRKQPESNGSEGHKLVKILDAAQKSIELGGKKIDL